MEKNKMRLKLIDFSKMTKVFEKTLDKDRIDITRKTTITSEDGWEVEIGGNTPLYKDIPCHIQPVTIDNPEVGNDPTKPVITSFTIHCKPSTDIINGDFITLKTCNSKGEVLEIQEGVAGEPRQYESRKEVSVGVMKWS